MLLIRFVICLCVCLVPTLAAAKDFFLTIGGGPRPDNNQVSLERNVLFHQEVLAARRPDRPAYELYFADGKSGNRDLQYRVPDFKTTCPPAGRILAEVLGDAASMDLFYRAHSLDQPSGPADPQLLRRRLRDLAKELQPGDRLFLYATAHGGPAKKSDDKAKVADKEKGPEKDRPADPQVFNTSLYCWNTTSITASEFADWLDGLDPEVSVMLVMVQCYSGGFAQTIFNGADAERGLAPHARFGFFAQVHDRPAAGCTPDIDQADYQEYSSFFWAALAGRTRAGGPITSADYDDDESVSFAEAHAYAVLESDTIDVPVRTTDVLLRTFSDRGSDNADKKPEQNGTKATLLKLAGPLAGLLDKARPEERAIIAGLSKRLALEDPTIESLRTTIEQHGKDIKATADRLASAKRATRRAKDRAQQDFYDTWPELRKPYSPLAVDLLSKQAEEFVRRVEKLPSYIALREALDREVAIDKEHLDLERQRAKVERLLRTAENIVLAANLPHVATPEIVARHEKLRRLEESTLAPHP
jgi:hypothetical protein